MNFFPFTGGEQFTFTNLRGKKLVFIDSLENEVKDSHIQMRTLCYYSWIDIQTSYYHSEHYSFLYLLRGEKASFQYTYLVNNENTIPATDSDTVLYDTFAAGFSAIESDPTLTYSFEYIVSDRGNTLRPTTTVNSGFTRIISDTTLNGNHYNNLYCPKIRPGIFYSTSYGIVLFYYKNEWWHLSL